MWWKWATTGGAFYLGALISVIIGVQRITQYKYDEDFPDESKYAFVGGDAYNYIINSNVMNGYFIIAIGLLIAGTVLIAAGGIIHAINKNQVIESPIELTQIDDNQQ